jgi:hypothetical protein
MCKLLGDDGFDFYVTICRQYEEARQQIEQDFVNERQRFIVLRESVTSGRMLRAHTALELLRIGIRLALGGPQSLRRRQGLEFWYGPREAAP